MDSIRQMIGLSATVRLPLFSKEAVWEAQFMRTSESLDLNTGALTVYVAVRQPYEKAKPSEQPPLASNLCTEVELQDSPRDNRYSVPVQAVHNGPIYLVDSDKRLRKHQVVVEMTIEDLAVICDGLSETALDSRNSEETIPMNFVKPWIATLTAHPTAVNLLMILFIMLGLMSIDDIRRETFPDFAPTDVSVTVAYPGATWSRWCSWY